MEDQIQSVLTHDAGVVFIIGTTNSGKTTFRKHLEQMYSVKGCSASGFLPEVTGCNKVDRANTLSAISTRLRQNDPLICVKYLLEQMRGGCKLVDGIRLIEDMKAIWKEGDLIILCKSDDDVLGGYDDRLQDIINHYQVVVYDRSCSVE